MVEAAFEKSLIELDPFGFMIDYGSAIRPLGGKLLSPDPKYAFHTPYVKYRAGRTNFTVRFEGLVATHGELSIHVNGFDPDSGRDAVLVNSVRLPLAMGGNEVAISILGVPGVSYALYGFISDATDATASALLIKAEELGLEEGEPSIEDIQPTQFGNTDLRRPAQLVDSSPPSLGTPVSQPLTAAQLNETAFTRWAGQMSKQSDRNSQWHAAFVLQALQSYGMLAEGAKGLALHDAAGLAGPLISAQGCSIVTSPSPSGEASETLRGFDFLWSIGTLNAMPGGRAIQFVEQAMRTLRPGGYAIFTFDMCSGDAPAPDPATHRAPYSQMLVERLALTIISRAHDVAQLKFGSDEPDHMPLYATAAAGGSMASTVPFGLIVRKR